MKKAILLSLTALVLLGGTTFAIDNRHPFDDALNMFEDERTIERYLKKYVTDDPARNTIGNLVKNNHFLREALREKFSDGYDSLEIAATAPVALPEPQSGLADKLGLVSPTTAIDALGTFVARRFKEELNIAYLNRFRRKLEENRDLRLLLPMTHALLVEANPYNYPSFLESLKAAIDDDLQNLLKNLPGLLRSHELAITAKLKDEDGFPTLMLMLGAVNSISEARPPAEVIVGVATDEYADKLANKNVRSALKLLGYVVEEFTVVGSYDWLGATSLDYLDETKMRNLFIGLFLEKYRDRLGSLRFVDTDGREVKFDINNVEKIGGYVAEVRGLITIAKSESRLLSNQLKDHGKITHELFNQFARSLIVLLERGVHLHTAFSGSEKDTFVEQKLIPIVKKILDISNHIAARDYGKVHVKALALFREIFPNVKVEMAFADSGDRLARVHSAMSTPESDISLPADDPSDSWKRLLELKEYFVKYGSFAVNVATAKSADEIVEALETAALPVGSYRVKRNTKFNISINAYMGGFVGSERILPERSGTEFAGKKGHFAFGFTAPVGVAFSWGKHKDNPKMNGWSKTVFISVLDIGAVAAFRLQDETSELPETDFENVLAPGGYFVLGIASSPISVGLGAQYGPQLRKVDLVDGNQIDSPAWRMAGFVAVDIPLFNLHTNVGSGN